MKQLIKLLMLGSMLSIISGISFAADEEKIQKFGDWAVGCSDLPEGKKSCGMVQQHTMKDSGTPVMKVLINKPDKKADANCAITLPLGILLPPGVGIQIDEAKMAVYPIQVCTQAGCIVAFKLDKKRLATLKKGTKMTVAFANFSGKEIRIDASLKGFSKAYGNISK